MYLMSKVILLREVVKGQWASWQTNEL